MLFKKFLKESNKKPNKIWVDKGSEGKSVVAERFIRTLKTKIYKCMTSISKNVYIDKLDNIINECKKIKYLILAIWLKKQSMIQKLLKLKRN